MDNNFDITRYTKLNNLINKLKDRFELDWSRLLNKNLSFQVKEVKCVRSREIMSKMNESRVLIEFVTDIGKKFYEKFFIMFLYQDAIIIAGSIIKEDKEKIEDWFSYSNMSAEYTNAFNKFCEQTGKGFDNTFMSHIPEKMSSNFSQYFISPKDNDKLREIFPLTGDQSTFVVNFNYFLLDFGNMSFDLLFPLELVEGFYGETVHFSSKRSIGKILVVDDSKSDIAIIRKHLRHSNYLIVESKDEQSALQQIFMGNIDLILLDIYLENENGLSLCRKIRRNMLCDYVPIIMYSWGATRENVTKSFRVGAQDFIAKPFDKDILLKKIIKHMQTKQKCTYFRY